LQIIATAVPQARVAVAAELLPDSPQLSIIIPVLNEADCLDRGLARLFTLQWVTNHAEVIISDGGSNDGSLDIANRYPCSIVHSNAGRATQMNAASKTAQGKFLLFLHADSTLPEDFNRFIDADAKWGFFRLRLNDDAFVYRIIEAAINLRTRVSQVAGGDQGLYFKRHFFESLNAYPKIPLMEDIAICKTARRLAKPLIIGSAISSSNRRWRDNGIVKTMLLMWSLRFAYWLGVDPRRLHKIYYP
jgi:rSAM/selenodomain-associated transferase 2